ncbi:MAG: glycosyltransferase family 39 protein, partial [Candidatus Omnitrophota bacterium]|nr:glycosyltransferase family 39 protein [Candidatus Omnitrophota bacterium]
MLSLISLEVTGFFFVLLLIRRGRYGCSVTEFLALSFFLGTGFVAYQSFLCYLLGRAFTFSNLMIVPTVLFILVFARYASNPGRLDGLFRGEKEFRRWDLIERLLLAGLAVQFLWTLFLVLPIPVNSHDAVANYALKAKIFHLAGGIPRGFFGWEEATVAHPDYPLFLPLLMTWIYAFTGFNDLTVNLVMPVVYLAFIGLFYSLIRKFFNRAYSLLVTFILATIPQLADYATVIHADLILSALVGCALAYFVLYIRRKEREYLVFSSILLGISLLVKNEAIVFTGAFFAVLTMFVLRSNPLRRKKILADIVVSFLIIVVIAAPWFAVKISSGTVNSDIDLSKMTAERLVQNARHIPVMLYLFQQEVFGPKKWNIFWMIFFAGIIWKARALLKGERFYITVFLVIAAAGYFCGYMAITGGNLYFYVNTTIPRFMLH